jgi:hypothetical protein
MALHLIKLCVGADSIADLEEWVAERMAALKARGEPQIPSHVTRMMPKRGAELLDGGSLYWVIKGQIAVRQTLEAIEEFRDDRGIERCRLWLGRTLIAVSPRPMRPFQGWRYLREKDAPDDLASSGIGLASMPEALRRELGALGLI